ncbi:aa3 type cytochrome c oxidase subunit IV [Sulfitobacter brevis]|uniref:Aa3 type cytochrome c oxidase subunit IV n=1 Tax=Sulfitobacter brevis TaxID=74348 RepID=A0A1I1TBI5_9RHOB|nr:aa3-type cytochrome c oxidase subunit IV [Sulfitobacter brevis]SFD55949.1 aa3 type cytochrome c oxidase subunit IV [Sulfitobacter brevis]
MAEHEHGSMNYDVQRKTFDGFMSFVTKTSIAIIVLLVLMAIFIS